MIKLFIQSTFRALGYRVTRLSSDDSPAFGLGLFLALTKTYGFAPKHVVDIGANHGNWTREALKHFPNAQFTLVEPQVELKIHVQDLIDSGCRVHWVHAGASDRSETATLNVYRRDYGSTFLQVPRTVDGATRRVDVPCKTLNEIVALSGLPTPDMVKIDAEGFDLRVLSGASELFGKTDIFLVEVSIGQRDFENTALAVIQKMADEGYRLVDITSLNRSPKCGALWLCDFAFLRNACPLFDAASSYE